MKIESGKYYKNANGGKVGPMRECDFGFEYAGSDYYFEGDGASLFGDDPDLISEWTDQNNGPDTLENLGLKVGDVVQCYKDSGMGNFRSYKTYTSMVDGSLKNEYGLDDFESISTFTVVSRASQTPKPFWELSDAEKGALLLAHHEGKRIEVQGSDGSWRHTMDPGFYGDVTYRIAPTRIAGTCEVSPTGEPITDTFEVTP